MSTEHGRGEPVGSVAEEAAKLFTALQGWASAGAGPHTHGAAPGEPHDPEAGRATAGEQEPCTSCPVCRAVAALRQTSPSVRAHLAVAASALLQAAAELLETRVPPPEERRATGVERIDLDREPGGDGEGWAAE